MTAAAPHASSPIAELLARPRRRPLVMGIVNVTPDSFYAGSRAPSAEDALVRGRRLIEDGAEILDVGGESTRPGSDPVSEAEELRRVVPVVERLAPLGVPLSVDTSKASVAEAALAAGAQVLNDVTALRGDPRMAAVAVRFPAVILMHMQGSPRTMQQAPRYRDVLREIGAFFRDRLAAFAVAGGDPSRAWLDPGIGFGKELAHNLEILRGLERFAADFDHPLVLGASRKAFIGNLLGGAAAPLPPEDRLEGSLAVALRAAEAGAAVVRVHDVRATLRALDVFAEVRP